MPNNFFIDTDSISSAIFVDDSGLTHAEGLRQYIESARRIPHPISWEVSDLEQAVQNGDERYVNKIISELEEFFTTGVPSSRTRVEYVDEDNLQIFIREMFFQYNISLNTLVVSRQACSAMVVTMTRELAERLGLLFREQDSIYLVGNNQCILYYNFNRQGDIDDSALLRQATGVNLQERDPMETVQW